MPYGNAYYPGFSPGMGSRPRLQSVHPFRHMVAAGTNMNGAWTGGGGGGGGGGSGHSGYGVEPPEYDYQSGPPAQVPSGGSYSYHSTAGTGYGVPPAPNPHPHPHPQAQPPASGGGGGKNKGGGGKRGSSSSSTMTALTLLSFFFFVNLLQSCIKDHMDYMNPTVMVMTTDIRKRTNFNKMGEMNSREYSSGASSLSSNVASGPNIVMQPADMLASAAMNSAKVMETMKPYVNLQSPYSGITGSVQRPMVATSAPPPQLPPAAPIVTQYQSHNPEPGVYFKKPYYDPHQPDVYEHHQHQQQQTDVYEHHHHQQQQPDVYEQHQHHSPVPPAPQFNPQQQHYQTPVINENHSTNHQPPVYMGSPMDHPIHQHQHPNTDYHYPSSAPSPAAPPPPQYSTPRNPFYEHQHPPSYSHKGDGEHLGSPQYTPETAHKYPQKYDDTFSPQITHNPQGPVPWSSDSSHSSLSSSSVVSGPFRRATIVSVSPTTKWISVATNVDDHTDFEREQVDDDTNRNHRYSESSHYRNFH